MGTTSHVAGFGSALRPDVPELSHAGLATVVQAEHSGDSALLELVMQHTLDINTGSRLGASETWIDDVRRSLDSAYRILREYKATATAAQDLPALATAALAEGDMLLLQGDTRSAQLCYQQARGLYPAAENVVLLSIVYADMLRGNWTMVHTSLSKSLKEDADQRILRAFGLACWNLGSFGDCAATFLRLDDLSSQWADPRAYAAVLGVSAILGLSREDLQYFAYADDLGKLAAETVPSLSDLVSAFLAVDIPKVWTAWTELGPVLKTSVFTHAGFAAAQTLLRKTLHQHYLAVRQRARLSETLDLFSTVEKCTVFDLTAETKRWGMAIAIDIVGDSLVVEPSASRAEMLDSVRVLAEQFVLDGAMLSWDN